MTRSEKCNESAGILHALRLTTSGGLCASQALRALRALAQFDGYGISERVTFDMDHEFSSLRALVHCACALLLRSALARAQENPHRTERIVRWGNMVDRS